MGWAGLGDKNKGEVMEMGSSHLREGFTQI